MLNLIKKNRYLIASFFIPLFFMLLLFFLNNITPFGSNSVVRIDMNNQYIALFTYFKDVLSDPSKLLYSTSLNLGGNFFGVFAYYLASPLNLLVIFFSNKNMPLFFSLLTLLKISMIGLSMFVYLTRSCFIQKKINMQTSHTVGLATIPSTAFALMSYVILYKECIMWLDAIILLPLVLLGFDRIISKGRWGLYALTLALSILTNYYFGYMICLFVCVIYVMWAVYQKVEKQKNTLILKVSLKFIASSLLAGLSSVVILIPGYMATAGVTKNTLFKFHPVYNALYFFDQLLGETQVSETPMIFAGCVVFMLVVMYFFNDHVRYVDKFFAFILIVFLFISTWIDAFYLIWHAFAWPNGYFQRSSFIIPFVFCVISYISICIVFDRNEEKGISLKNNVSAITFVLLIEIIVKFQLGLSAKYLIVLNSLIFLMYCAIYYKRRELQKKNFRIVMLLIISLSSLFVVDFKLQKYEVHDGSNANSYAQYYSETHEIYQKIIKSDHSFYRIGNKFQISENDPLLFNFNGLSNYVSQQKASLTDFMSALGYYQKHGWYRWSNYNDGSTLSMNRLLGVKYTVGNNSTDFYRIIRRINKDMSGDNIHTQSPSDHGIKTIKNGNYVITTDKLAFPLVSKIVGKNSTTIKYASYNPEANPFKLQNKIWKDISSVRNMYTKQRVLFTGRKGNYSVKVSRSGNVYMYYPTKRTLVSDSFKVFVNGNYVTTMYQDEGENGIVCLGNYSKGKQLTVKLIPGTKKRGNKLNYNKKPMVAVENMSMFLTARNKMVGRDITSIQMKGRRLNFSTTSKFNEHQILITLPYDAHWHATVDGKKVIIQRRMSDLMGIEVPSGKHHVKVIYQVPGLRLGIIVSGMAILVTCSVGVVVILKREGKKSRISL